MPGYVSHMIMAKSVYDKIKAKNVSLDYMITYSLGGDLCKYSKCRWDSHHLKQDLFIENMCNYIKDNKLINDKEIIGVLYGHICHLVMDNILHPLIRKIDKECIENKNNHTLIEGYIDSYLVRYLYDKNIYEYDNKVLFMGRMNKKVSKIINKVYYQTYGIKRISLYYRFNKFLYSKIRFLYKIFNVKIVRKISGFDKFMENNKSVDFINLDGLIEYKNFFGNVCNSDLISLYEDSVDETIKYIDKVNSYLEIK